MKITEWHERRMREDPDYAAAHRALEAESAPSSGKAPACPRCTGLYDATAARAEGWHVCECPPVIGGEATGGEPTPHLRCDECGKTAPLDLRVRSGQAHRGCPKGMGHFRLVLACASVAPARGNDETPRAPERIRLIPTRFTDGAWVWDESVKREPSDVPYANAVEYVRADISTCRRREPCLECGHVISHYSRCSRARSSTPSPSSAGAAPTHADCGKGDTESGPQHPDCVHRGTAQQAECAAAGCGFCRAAGAAPEREPWTCPKCGSHFCRPDRCLDDARSAPPPPPTEADRYAALIEQMRHGFHCLALEIPEEIAEDLEAKVDAVLASLTTQLSASRTEAEILREAAWTHSDLVQLDRLMVFGQAYDFEGLERCREEIHTRAGSYVVWPDRLGGAKRWSAYGGPDGALMMEKFGSADEAKAWVLTELAASRSSSPTEGASHA